MLYGLSYLSVIALRLEASDTSEIVSQVLYGESFKVLEQRKYWSRIRLAIDKYEGWIDNKQFKYIKDYVYKDLQKETSLLTTDLVDFITDENQKLHPILLGSCLNGLPYLKHQFEGAKAKGNLDKSNIVDTAMLYLNTPYLWGGKTPFGIDCSGFTQMVYRLNGFNILRDASQQASQGEALSFIEESSPGDLAFFDNSEGEITHVGIIMKDNRIIHAHGKVRIDLLDQSGIYNVDSQTHSHKLRVIKTIVS